MRAKSPALSDPYTVLVERDEEGYFVATVPALQGCHTQAKSLDTLMRRVRETIALCSGDKPQQLSPQSRI